MAYEKQNFEKGQILKADHLNHMEDGIESNSLPIVLDTSLKISGAAADSKAVGDIIIQEHNRAVSKETEINNSVVAQNSVIGELQQEIIKTTPTTTVTDSATWSSKHIVDMLCPPISETGNPVQCYPVARYPLGCKVSWEPTQEGSGDPSPDNVRPIKGRDSVTVERCGENLLNFHIEKETRGISITTESDGRYHLKGILNMDGFSCSIDTIHLPAGTYTVNKASISSPLAANAIVITLRKITPTSSESWIETTANLARNTGSLAKPTDILISFYGSTASIKKGTVIDAHFELILVSGATAPTTYTPYTGQTATLTLPSTIYGGTVDAVTGEGIKNWKRVVFDGTERWNVRTVNYTSYVLPLPMRSNTGFCTHFKKILYDAIRPNTGTGETGCYLEFSSSVIFNVPFENVADWKNYLAAQYAAGTPVYIVFQYANDVNGLFTATGAQPITALSGVNTVLTDADSATVTGRADPIKRITDLEDAIASMTTT